MQRKGALSSLLILASLLIALCALIGGGNIESTLDNILKQDWGGLSYAAGFVVSGLAFAVVAAYAAYLVLTGWKSHAFLKALNWAVLVPMLASVICSIWFIASTGYFGWQGVLGIAACLIVGGALRGVLRLLAADVSRRHAR